MKRFVKETEGDSSEKSIYRYPRWFFDPRPIVRYPCWYVLQQKGILPVCTYPWCKLACGKRAAFFLRIFLSLSLPLPLPFRVDPTPRVHSLPSLWIGLVRMLNYRSVASRRLRRWQLPRAPAREKNSRFERTSNDGGETGRSDCHAQPAREEISSNPLVCRLLDWNIQVVSGEKVNGLSDDRQNIAEFG